MKLTDVIKTLQASLDTYLKANLRNFTQDGSDMKVLVETYRLDSQAMEQSNMFGPRIAIYDGGDNVTASIPGMAQFRGDRVAWGYPLSTMQTIRIDLAFNIAERGMDGWNELELICIKDAVIEWVKTYGETALHDTDGGISAFVYGSSNGVTRLKKYAYTTLTCYAIYNP